MDWLGPLLVGVVFFILIPAWGANGERQRWRRFRKNLLEATQLPLVKYSHITSPMDQTLNARFFGRLEAIEGNDRIWISDGTLTLCAQMGRQEVFILPRSSEVQEDGDLPGFNFRQETPKRVPWKALSSLPEGTRFFLSGPLHIKKGQGEFCPSGGHNLFILIHEGRDEDLLELAMATGRQKNEHWNPLTPVSMAVGFVVLLGMAYSYFRIPGHHSEALLSLSLALLPSTFFLPPGILFFFLYTSLWRQSAMNRILRDLAQIPLGYFPQSDRTQFTLPTGELIRRWPLKSLTKSEAFPRRLGQEKLGPQALLVALADGEGQPLEKPAEDPMAYLGKFPDEPGELVQRHKKKARSGEIMALVFLILGALTNGIFLFSLLGLWIR